MWLSVGLAQWLVHVSTQVWILEGRRVRPPLHVSWWVVHFFFCSMAAGSLAKWIGDKIAEPAIRVPQPARAFVLMSPLLKLLYLFHFLIGFYLKNVSFPFVLFFTFLSSTFWDPSSLVFIRFTEVVQKHNRNKINWCQNVGKNQLYFFRNWYHQVSMEF